MPLRFRLISLIAVVLLLSLAVGGLVGGFNASRSVRTEMRSALLVARQTVENAVERLQSSGDPDSDLENLIASFRGNRHLRVSLIEEGGTDIIPAVQPAADRSPFGHVPAWFVRLIGSAPSIETIPVAGAGRAYRAVKLETDPRNEVGEVWIAFSDSFVMMALFCGLSILLIYLFLGRALRPLDELAAALQSVGAGAFGTRIVGKISTDLAHLRDSFNHMAARLAEIDKDNRRLHDRLLSLQEQERSDLARDLHDEVGPLLFAINVDVANISRLAREGRDAEIPGELQSITDAVGDLQGQVRSMVGRLRPPGLAEFGLAAAIGNLVEFWKRRTRAINFHLDVAQDCCGFGELLDTTIYRIVQECLSNAVRHGKPNAVSVTIAAAEAIMNGGSRVTIAVKDNGGGMKEPEDAGFGLRGMRERVSAMGGHLTIANLPGCGVEVVATLPYSREARVYAGDFAS